MLIQLEMQSPEVRLHTYCGYQPWTGWGCASVRTEQTEMPETQSVRRWLVPWFVTDPGGSLQSTAGVCPWSRAHGQNPTDGCPTCSLTATQVSWRRDA